MRFRQLILHSSAEDWARGGVVAATADGLETGISGQQATACEMQEVVLDNWNGLSSVEMY